MTFPIALCICLIFLTGIATGIAGIVLWIKWTTSYPQNRINLLRLLREKWPEAWDVVFEGKPQYHATNHE